MHVYRPHAVVAHSSTWPLAPALALLTVLPSSTGPTPIEQPNSDLAAVLDRELSSEVIVVS